MSNLRTFLLGAALIATINTGCGDNLEAVPDAGPPEPPPVSFTECASDTASWVRNTYLAIVGHRPHSQAEVDVYVTLHDRIASLATRGQTTLNAKEVVARAMAKEPGYVERWTSHFMDALRVTRTDDQAMGTCYDNHGTAGATSELAGFVRDNPPTASRDRFSMLDLVQSAVALDDPTPIYRGHLFALVSFPLFAANADPVQAELARRADSGAIFDSAYLNRDLVCLTCHNSERSVTDHATPELDRHWPMAGLYERALYGASSGIEPERAHAVFRFDGFAAGMFSPTPEGPRKPWGWDPQCGSFYDETPPDLAGIDGKFGDLSGMTLNAYDLEASLHAGFDGLRGRAIAPAADGTIADPDQALAYLTASTIVEGVWKEVVGTGLTIANYFPRNQASSDLLKSLTDRFVASGYSIQDLLVAIVSSDYFSRQLPEEGCGDDPYIYPNVFDPWVISDDDEARRHNGPADAIAALSARTLMRGTYQAMGWPVPIDFDFPGGGGGPPPPPPPPDCSGLSCTELSASCNSFFECCPAYEAQCLVGTGETCEGQTCEQLATSCDDHQDCCNPYYSTCVNPPPPPPPVCEAEGASCTELAVMCNAEPFTCCNEYFDQCWVGNGETCEGQTCEELAVTCDDSMDCCDTYYFTCVYTPPPPPVCELEGASCTELVVACNTPPFACCGSFSDTCLVANNTCEGQTCEELAATCNGSMDCCYAYLDTCVLAPPGGGRGGRGGRGGEGGRGGRGGRGEPPVDPSLGLGELAFQQGVGAFLKNGERGFRGLDFQARLVWEDRFGTCDDRSEKGGEDFVDQLVAAASADATATVQDVVVALKDRLIGEPSVDAPGEAEALAVVMGGGLDRTASSVTDLEERTRGLCGVLLSTPQFVLSGAAGRGGELPRLTPEAWQFGAVCAEVSARAVEVATAGSGLTIVCEDGAMTVTVAAP